MAWDLGFNKKKISNIGQGMQQIYGREKTSSFDIPCSIFDIPSRHMAS
jgi:hypothetical protein